MKNRHYIHPATLFFVLSVVVVLLSWIGNIYGWEGVRNLLSAEGLRWKLRTVGDTFLNVPFLGDMMILFLGGGLAVHSGWSAASLKLLKKRSQLSRRELKAWLMGTVCGIIILLLWGILAWGPWGGLRSISGGISDSPLQEGSACILSAILVSPDWSMAMQSISIIPTRTLSAEWPSASSVFPNFSSLFFSWYSFSGTWNIPV